MMHPDAYMRKNEKLSLDKGHVSYNQDGLATVHNCDFLSDERFIQAYQTGKETDSWGGADIHWRMHVILWAANIGASLDGDFVECGVNKGGLSRAVIEYVSFNDLGKMFYLLDTFCGLDERFISDEERECGVKAGTYDECYEVVKQTFGPHNTCIVKGAIPDTLEQVSTNKVAYLSIDMNCAEPEIAAAEFFWEKLVPGAPVVLDDYGWSKHYEQKKAFDLFAERKGIEILSLPTGQGLFIKPMS